MKTIIALARFQGPQGQVEAGQKVTMQDAACRARVAAGDARYATDKDRKPAAKSGPRPARNKMLDQPPSKDTAGGKSQEVGGSPGGSPAGEARVGAQEGKRVSARPQVSTGSQR